jgi:hypothetical protein
MRILDILFINSVAAFTATKLTLIIRVTSGVYGLFPIYFTPRCVRSIDVYEVIIES